MGAYAPDDVHARALAMLSAGSTAREAAAVLGVSYVTVYRWLDKARNDPQLEEEDKRQLYREYRISEKADAIIEDGLDTLLEQGGAAAVKSLIPLNAIAGTYRDKIMKRKDSGKATQFQNFVLVQVNNANPETTVNVATIEHTGNPE